MEGRTRGGEEGKGWEMENGKGRGKGGSWGNNALVVGVIDAPGKIFDNVV